MQILIIGGTQYIGRYLVDYLLDQNHELTLFHRGKTNVDIFPGVERILGDRNTDLDRLGDKNWDVVIDTCGYTPEQVKASVDYLTDQVGHYVYISSIDALEPSARPGLTEDDATQNDDFSGEKVGWWKTEYGRNKAICEQIVTETFGPDHVLIIRPGMVIGPHDPVLFFPFWVLRMKKGGTILAPGEPDQPLQYVDVRDLTSLIAKLVDNKETGIYIITGPSPSDNLGSFLTTLKKELAPDAILKWVDTDFLLVQDMVPEQDIPYWLPGDEIKGYCNLDNQKAMNAGLSLRPLAQTTRDVADWVEHQQDDQLTLHAIADRGRGLDPDREAELLELYEHKS